MTVTEYDKAVIAMIFTEVRRVTGTREVILITRNQVEDRKSQEISRFKSLVWSRWKHVYEEAEDADGTCGFSFEENNEPANAVV